MFVLCNLGAEILFEKGGRGRGRGDTLWELDFEERLEVPAAYQH